MPRESFQAELDALRADVVGMGEHVLGQLDDALRALETGDAELATDVVDGDAAVNERYLDLEARCVDLFALQQPVASDLRFVAAAFKVCTDLERVGDLATNLGQYALAAGDVEQPLFGSLETDAATPPAGDAADSTVETPPPSVIDIGRDASAMLEDALAAFEAGDAEACVEIAERDDDLDVLCQHAGEAVVRQLLETGVASAAAEAGDAGDRADVGDRADATDPSAATGPTGASGRPDAAATSWDVEAALDDVSRVLLAIRDLERVGDHAVNVAARTYYAVEHDPTLIV